jgi:hypothetical protein
MLSHIDKHFIVFDYATRDDEPLRFNIDYMFDRLLGLARPGLPKGEFEKLWTVCPECRRVVAVHRFLFHIRFTYDGKKKCEGKVKGMPGPRESSTVNQQV